MFIDFLILFVTLYALGSGDNGSVFSPDWDEAQHLTMSPCRGLPDGAVGGYALVCLGSQS